MCVKGGPKSEDQPITSLYHMHRNLKVKQLFISETEGSAVFNATKSAGVNATNTSITR